MKHGSETKRILFPALDEDDLFTPAALPPGKAHPVVTREADGLGPIHKEKNPCSARESNLYH